MRGDVNEHFSFSITALIILNIGNFYADLGRRSQTITAKLFEQ